MRRNKAGSKVSTKEASLCQEEPRGQSLGSQDRHTRSAATARPTVARPGPPLAQKDLEPGLSLTLPRLDLMASSRPLQGCLVCGPRDPQVSPMPSGHWTGGHCHLFLGQSRAALPLVKLTSAVRILRTTDHRTEGKSQLPGSPVYSQECIPSGFLGGAR